LALDDNGSLYGWGSNSNMQLSHEEEFSMMNSPLLAAFTPIKISRSLDGSEILDMKAGGEFSVLVARNKLSGSYEVFTFGSNLKGQLAQGEVRHLRDVTKVEALSDFILRRRGKEEKVLVTHLGCGLAHSIVLLNIGYVMEWGDNEHGQMGNRRRSAVYTPIIVREFSERDIVGVFAGNNASGVIVREEETKPNAQ
jgi:alpha-tubulin suppressor-like RCC1 family protein